MTFVTLTSFVFYSLMEIVPAPASLWLFSNAENAHRRAENPRETRLLEEPFTMKKTISNMGFYPVTCDV